VNQDAIAAAKQARATLDDNQRRTLYYKVQDIHMKDAPFIYLYVLPYVDILKKNVQGFVHHPMGQWYITRTSIKK
jgi:ABC-type transport system substrate-binding protein